MLSVKIKRLNSEARLPEYAFPGDAGLDLFSCENYTIKPSERRTFPVGIALELPNGYVGLVWDKSGLASKKGIHCLSGVLDSGYRGELMIVLLNTGENPQEIKKGDKIAQLLVQPVEQAKIVEVEKLSDTERGQGGFGSTGR
ncbi:MAG: dUTP diphosphatase [Patescibacteria group bacterium]|nr:dUTP diphosphatase [Patescibacteria group bacterium]